MPRQRVMVQIIGQAGIRSQAPSTLTESGIYLIHFERPLCHARHYLGFATNIARRWKTHCAGKAARLTAVLRERQIGFSLVRVWIGGTRLLERRLKRFSHVPLLCPICHPTAHRGYHLANPLVVPDVETPEEFPW
jgi:predicted GIY-YIG superfamily endonuclease